VEQRIFFDQTGSVLAQSGNRACDGLERGAFERFPGEDPEPDLGPDSAEAWHIPAAPYPGSCQAAIPLIALLKFADPGP
jgi:hypothetical protein